MDIRVGNTNVTTAFHKDDLLGRRSGVGSVIGISTRKNGRRVGRSVDVASWNLSISGDVHIFFFQFFIKFSLILMSLLIPEVE